MFQDYLTTELLSRMPDYLPVGICVVDENLRVVQWNQTLARWTGIPHEQIVSEQLADFYPQFKEPRYQNRMQDAIKQNLPVVFAAAIHKRIIPVPAVEAGLGLMYQDVTVRPISGFPGFLVITIADVTARYLQTESLRRERNSLKDAMASIERQAEALKSAQSRACEASQTKTEFLANVSHEIRTPMTAILGFTEIVMDNDTEPDIRQAAVETIRSNGEHLLELINDILDVSRIEAGRLELTESQCSIRTIIEGLRDTFLHRARERHLSFICDVQKDVPDVLVTDPLRLRQLLINLLGNAFKFTDSGSVRLSVSMGRQLNKPAVCFEVADTGIGMTKNQISRLFKPFVQVDTSPTRRFHGTGLGLVICKRVVEMLGGHIELESESGVGSQFRLYLPASSEHQPNSFESFHGIHPMPLHQARVSQPVTRIRRANGPLDGLHVLLVDDGPDNQKLLDFRLRRDGAKCAIAQNGQEAVELVLDSLGTADEFDVVLMDMQMPVMDGYTATRGIREAGFVQPVIAITAHAMSHDRQKCLEAGCSGYHTKPVNWSELRELILDSVQEPAVVT